MSFRAALEKWSYVATPRQRILFACACVRLAGALTPLQEVAVSLMAGKADVGDFQPVKLDYHFLRVRGSSRAGKGPGLLSDREVELVLRHGSDSVLAVGDLEFLSDQAVEVILRCGGGGVLEVGDLAARVLALSGRGRAEKVLLGLLDDVAGPTVRPVVPWAQVKAAHVVRVAAGIYMAEDWAALPVLGDALEEAGCRAPALLHHCRGPGPHARGCWLLDLILHPEQLPVR